MDRSTHSSFIARSSNAAADAALEKLKSFKFIVVRVNVVRVIVVRVIVVRVHTIRAMSLERPTMLQSYYDEQDRGKLRTSYY